jgi:hypothetical protein
MMLPIRESILGVALIACIEFTGCSYGPARINQPGIDASSAGSEAMTQYDKNGDGVVAGPELDAAPALKAALPRLDTNGDKGVSADEVAARVAAWKEMESAMTTVRCHVTLDGQPLADAEVVFEPEAFLGDNIKPATAKTNQLGDASPRVAPEHLPDPSLPSGAHFGLYIVRISKKVNGKELIPARYNTNTVLGQEVSYDDPAMQNNNVAFALKK